MYAKIIKGQVAKWPYSMAELWAEYPNTSFPANPSDDTLAAFNVFRVELENQPEVPLDKTVELGQPTLVDGQWRASWVLVPATAEQIEQRKAALVAEYVALLEAHYDAKARERRYDNRLTCALRAGYPGPFQAEGQAFAVWMDNCNAYAYQVLAEVDSGARPLPTFEELVAEMPQLVWP